MKDEKTVVYEDVAAATETVENAEKEKKPGKIKTLLKKAGNGVVKAGPIIGEALLCLGAGIAGGLGLGAVCVHEANKAEKREQAAKLATEHPTED